MGTTVSVVLPVYQGEHTLTPAISSILAQQGIDGDVELLVIDDGSTDQSLRLAIDIASESNSSNIAIFHHENIGLAATLNRGASLASGRYIARQDQDDIVMPGRLAKQVEFLNANQHIAMVGTWAQIYYGDTQSSRYHRHPSSNAALQLELLFDNPFVHSSMMIRKNVLEEVGGYSTDNSRQPPEDYELWSRVARRYEVANLPEVLTIYREVSGSMSRSGVNPFLDNVIRISSENLHYFLESKYSIDQCVALAELYHLGVSTSLTKSMARDMLKNAAYEINHSTDNWSEEFESTYKRIRAHLDSRFLRRRVPKPLLVARRWIKNSISKMLD